MNDDNDLLFGVDDLDRYVRGEQPDGWLRAQTSLLIARCRALDDQLKALTANSRRPAVKQIEKQP